MTSKAQTINGQQDAGTGSLPPILELKGIHQTYFDPKTKKDFVVFNDIIVEIKAQKGIVEEHYSQVLNYLAVSKCKIGLIYNFGEQSLITKRVILIKNHIPRI